MNCIKSRNNLLSNDLSDNAGGIETDFFSNGEPVPSTSGSSANLLPQEIKNYSWRQACFKLSTIFPNADPEFIKEIYIRKSSDKNLREEAVLEAVVEELFKNKVNDARFEISLENSEQNINVDNQIQYLESVFPDANPLYLKFIALKNFNDLNLLQKFIEEKLETRDYPTKEFYVPSKNKKGVQEQEFVDSFNVEQFLESFPDPVKVFENPDRKCTYDVAMFNILKNHFSKLKISTISDVYTRSSFNANLAFESLQTMKFEIKKKRKKSTVKTENTQVLQEFAYIKYKQRIKNYIKQKKDREEKMLQRMKDNKELLECECCYEELPDIHTFATTCGEGHVFCGMCLKRGTESELAKGAVKITCFKGCGSEFSLIKLQKVLKPTTFKILLNKIQEQEVKAAKIEGLVSCPFCHFASIPPESEKVFKCMNPDCGQESCRLCKKPNHLPKECEILEKTKKARLILEEQMTAALVRKCGKCGLEFIKDGGCNVMTCSCGATSCYKCGQLSISHDHLNGECIKSVTSDMDARAVVYVAKKVESELLKLDPNLKINADSILPSVPNAMGNVDLPTHALGASTTTTLPQL